MNVTMRVYKRPAALLLAGVLSTSANGASQEETEKLADDQTMLVTAEEELKQQPGVSVITAQDIRKNPPVNDLSDIIRKMPGVNLTGNSANGVRGNNRQIDIRGMGPENTLILIDGVPTTSRNSVRYSWRGERDSRGDSNWVPPEMVERIEVIRGPAAARYGSGAAGGVVNIITKRPTDHWSGSLSLYTNQPEDNKEGATRRANFNLSGPLAGDALTMRLYGNINKTDSDAFDINQSQNGSAAAGREGVRNKDINSVLSWKITPLQVLDFSYGYSRQGNIYAGDTQYSNGAGNALIESLDGAETNRLYRQTWGLAHNGIWDWGQSKLTFNYEKTNNTRLNEGTAGSGEGRINSRTFSTSRFDSYRAGGEISFPLELLREQTVTLGAEWNRDELNDPNSMNGTRAPGVSINGVSGDPGSRNSKNSATLSSLYVEDNIALTDSTEVIPGLRFDYHDTFGANWSPSLNISQGLGDSFTLKAGIARAFKAPNLYQSSEGYLLATRGNGCPVNVARGSCFLLGNENLDPEVSVNKELGIEYSQQGYIAGITWFRNDYKNKIVSGTEVLGYASNGNNILQWSNGGKAVVEGLEGNVTIPLVQDTLEWRTNATYMIESKDKETGNPLSIIPKYTINTLLDWQVTQDFSTDLNWTMYGRQKPRRHAESRTENGSMSDREVGAYSVFGINFNYDITKNLRANAGINNLLDKQLYREADGASTYNEPGRAYYAGLTFTF